MRRFLTFCLVAIGLWLLVACGADEAYTNTDSSAETSEEIIPDGSSASSDETSSSVGSERAAEPLPASPAIEKEVASSDASEPLTLEEAADAPAGDAALDDDEAFRSGEAALEQQTTPLTAGEVDDNANWDDYLLYLRNYQGEAGLSIDTSVRHRISVTDEQGQPLPGVAVEILDGGQVVTTLRTHSDGTLWFFPNTVGMGGRDFEMRLRDLTGVDLVVSAELPQREWTLVAEDGAQPDEIYLDVLFLIDATGSMADEIAQLTDNIGSIAAQIQALPSNPNVRFSLVAYRDEGEEYLTRVTDFTPEINQFSAALATIEAVGGGDYPEDLNAGLDSALHDIEWRTQETVSLMFLVGDAPPHLDYGQDYQYDAALKDANRLGIKIYPIASSGLDELGEYVYRQLAQVTGGRFIFLTYGSSGAGSTGEETDLNVDDYTVSALDDLVVKIVTEELEPLTR